MCVWWGRGKGESREHKPDCLEVAPAFFSDGFFTYGTTEPAKQANCMIMKLTLMKSTCTFADSFHIFHILIRNPYYDSNSVPCWIGPLLCNAQLFLNFSHMHITCPTKFQTLFIADRKFIHFSDAG